jgi:hypothetical protein
LLLPSPFIPIFYFAPILELNQCCNLNKNDQVLRPQKNKSFEYSDPYIYLRIYYLYTLQFFPPLLYWDMTLYNETLLHHFWEGVQEQTLNVLEKWENKK